MSKVPRGAPSRKGKDPLSKKARNIGITEDLRFLLERYELSEETCDSPVSDQHLGDISRSCCSKWRSLYSHFGMRKIVVRDIDRKTVDEDEKRAAFFDKWQDMMGSGATYRVLLHALLKVGCKDDAEIVCGLLQESLCQQSSPGEHESILVSRS